MRTNVVTKDPFTGANLVSQDVIDALKINGTYLPNVVRVVFNLKTTEKVPVKNEDGSEKKVPAVNRDGSELKTKTGETIYKTIYETRKLDNPVLVTKVWWADNTTTTVRNSEHDKVEIEEVTLENGVKVAVASEYSKTLGIAMAVTKRTCGVPDSNGEMIETNLGKILNEIVTTAHDQQLEEAKAKMRKSKARKIAEENRAKPKTKSHHYSTNEFIQMLGPVLEAVAKQVAKDPNALSKLLNINNETEDGEA